MGFEQGGREGLGEGRWGDLRDGLCELGEGFGDPAPPAPMTRSATCMPEVTIQVGEVRQCTLNASDVQNILLQHAFEEASAEVGSLHYVQSTWVMSRKKHNSIAHSMCGNGAGKGKGKTTNQGKGIGKQVMQPGSSCFCRVFATQSPKQPTLGYNAHCSQMSGVRRLFHIST